MDALRVGAHFVFRSKEHVAPVQADPVSAAAERHLLHAAHVADVQPADRENVLPHLGFFLAGMTDVGIDLEAQLHLMRQPVGGFHREIDKGDGRRKNVQIVRK